MNYWMWKVFWGLVVVVSLCQTRMMPKPTFDNMYAPVCGSNFKTYSSHISFLAEKKRIKSLVIIYTGKCKRVCTLYIPVCGSDSKTYDNICHLDYAKTKNRNLSLQYIGKCKLNERFLNRMDQVGPYYVSDERHRGFSRLSSFEQNGKQNYKFLNY